MHYQRAHPGDWAARLALLRAAGFNTVTTYVEWSLHEPLEGAFDFASADRNLAAWLAAIAAADLLAIVRIGPYITAELDLGGLPFWLTTVPGIQLRTNDTVWLGKVDRYLDALAPVLAPFLYSAGGPVIDLQIEDDTDRSSAARRAAQATGAPESAGGRQHGPLGGADPSCRAGGPGARARDALARGRGTHRVVRVDLKRARARRGCGSALTWRRRSSRPSRRVPPGAAAWAGAGGQAAALRRGRGRTRGRSASRPSSCKFLGRLLSSMGAPGESSSSSARLCAAQRVVRSRVGLRFERTAHKAPILPGPRGPGTVPSSPSTRSACGARAVRLRHRRPWHLVRT